MSNSDNMDQIVLHTIVNSNVDIISDEFSSSESENEENEESINSDILPYDDEDILEAKRLGMTVADMFKMYQEINNYEIDEHENCHEWPFNYDNVGYYDEGMEESFYG